MYLTGERGVHLQSNQFNLTPFCQGSFFKKGTKYRTFQIWHLLSYFIIICFILFPINNTHTYLIPFFIFAPKEGASFPADRHSIIAILTTIDGLQPPLLAFTPLLLLSVSFPPSTCQISFLSSHPIPHQRTSPRLSDLPPLVLVGSIILVLLVSTCRVILPINSPAQ